MELDAVNSKGFLIQNELYSSVNKTHFHMNVKMTMTETEVDIEHVDHVPRPPSTIFV